MFCQPWLSHNNRRSYRRNCIPRDSSQQLVKLIAGTSQPMKGIKPRMIPATVTTPNTIIDCMAWKRTNLLSCSIKRNIIPLTHPKHSTPYSPYRSRIQVVPHSRMASEAPVSRFTGRDLCSTSGWELTARCHGSTIGDKAVRAGMPHCELKWGIPG